MDIEQLMALIMEMLGQEPNNPSGELAGGETPMGPPSFAETPDPLMAQLMQLLQMAQMQQAQSAQQGMNAVQGQQGGMYGAMGGRPVGS